ncbi:acyl-CoA dehydrogenase family protein [Pseudonocardia spinosispora]|uniref:acyl-CoA dehydrogenase family protein n=1 Tax=Pseudonocardia spinosispora TaxID=103441 RepID=UPI000417F1AB|nr:acyl-CoA dehydrogenase family protein [Pseudonocardia spinosispora]
MSAGTENTSSADETAELTAMARSVFADHPAEVTEGLPETLWSTLTELGLTQLTLPEQAGGSGGTLADAAALLLVAGEASAAVPLAETDLLGGWLLNSAGLAVPAGPLTAVADDRAELSLGTESSGDVRVSGELRRVAWARHATRVAVLVADPDGGDLVLSVDPSASGVECAGGTNLAGEPRDDVRLDVVISAADVAKAPEGTRELLGRRAALARALLLAGAAGKALARSIQYAGERVQFGRPISKFQAIQQQLALAAAELAAGRAAAEAAARIAAASDFSGDDAGFAVAVAKARTSEAAGVIARIAHQVHGAIGFTLEHDLRLSTTRLWAWREEDGSDSYWHAAIGRRVLAEGADGLWPLLVRSS